MEEKVRTCKQIKIGHDKDWGELYERYRKEMDKTKRKEFPIGANVKWRHGMNYVKGIVIEYPRYCGETEVVVQNKNTKNKREIKAWELEQDD